MIEGLSAAGVLALCLLLIPLSGWWLAVRLWSDPLVRFTAACLTGVAVLAGVETLVYALGFPPWVALVALACVCLFSARSLAGTFRSAEFEWPALLAWGGTAAILVAATLRYAVHGYGDTAWDWYEHWLRSLIFLTHAPVTTKIGIYTIPARGPLFNAAAALLMRVSGSSHYWVFQIIAIAFNSLICLPFALILESVSGLSRRRALLVGAGVCILVPFFFWNNTYSWTKDLTAAYVLIGIHGYLTAFRKGDGAGMARSLAWFAVGFLSHFLALLYAVTLGLHLVYVRRHQLPIRGLIHAALVWAVLLVPWFGYLFFTFGVQGALGANTTVGGYYVTRDLQGRALPFGRVLIVNLFSDLFPSHSIMPSSESPTCATITVKGSEKEIGEGPCTPGFNTNGIYSILGYSGIVAFQMAVVGLLLLRREIREGRFLLWLLGAGLLFNLLPIRWIDPGGTFGENLQAWCLVLFAVAVRGLLRLPRAAITAVTVAMFAEFAVADIRSVRQQSAVLPLAQHESALRGNPPLGTTLPVPVSDTLFRTGFSYHRNYVYKISGGAVYFRDLHPDTFAPVSWMLLGAGLLALTGISLTRGHRAN
jgi:hypothetical protein